MISMAAARILFSLSDWNNSITSPIKNRRFNNSEKIWNSGYLLPAISRSR